MKLSIAAGSTSQSVNVFIQDSSSTTGAGLTGLAYNTSGLTAYYSFAGANATATAITLATLAAVTSAWSSGGFKEIDATNMPGWYRLDLPNACLAGSKGRSVGLHLKGATNMAPLPIEIELTGWDNQDAVRGGLTALPNANAAANGGLPTVDGNNAVKLQSGTGANQISLSSGTVTVGTNNDKTGYTVSTVSDKTGYSLTQSFPTNFSSLAISVGGAVTVGTNNDKTGYTASTVSDKTGYALTSAYDAAKTASQAGDAMALTTAERNSTADALLGRNVAGGSSTGRLVKEALYFLRNKWSISAGTLTVYGTDDTTSAWTATVGTDGTANPIVSNDPA